VMALVAKYFLLATAFKKTPSNINLFIFYNKDKKFVLITDLTYSKVLFLTFSFGPPFLYPEGT
jgi:hypothetical protein